VLRLCTHATVVPPFFSQPSVGLPSPSLQPTSTTPPLLFYLSLSLYPPPSLSPSAGERVSISGKPSVWNTIVEDVTVLTNTASTILFAATIGLSYRANVPIRRSQRNHIWTVLPSQWRTHMEFTLASLFWYRTEGVTRCPRYNLRKKMLKLIKQSKTGMLIPRQIQSSNTTKDEGNRSHRRTKGRKSLAGRCHPINAEAKKTKSLT
jgi:hypothetical protein